MILLLRAFLLERGEFCLETLVAHAEQSYDVIESVYFFKLFISVLLAAQLGQPLKFIGGFVSNEQVIVLNETVLIEVTQSFNQVTHSVFSLSILAFLATRIRRACLNQIVVVDAVRGHIVSPRFVLWTAVSVPHDHRLEPVRIEIRVASIRRYVIKQDVVLLH